MPPRPGPEEPGQFAFGDRARVERILTGAGFAGLAIEPLDVEKRAHVRDRVPKASRRPSPNRLMPSTSTNSATPGMTITQGLKNM